MKLNEDVKKVVRQLKDAHTKFHSAMKDKSIMEEARKYATKQKGEIHKLISGDLTLVKKFLEAERKNLEKLQKKLPGEIDRLSKFVNNQKKEFEGLLSKITKKARKKVRATGKIKKTVATNALSAGTAPDFNLSRDGGGMLSLGSLRGKWVVLFFYPKDMTPGCTIEARNFQTKLNEFKEKGAEIIGISRDSVESHNQFCEAEKLTYPLVSDPNGEIAKKYGVLTDAGFKRTTFVIDPNGKIHKTFENVRVDGHATQVLQSIQ